MIAGYFHIFRYSGYGKMHPQFFDNVVKNRSTMIRRKRGEKTKKREKPVDWVIGKIQTEAGITFTDWFTVTFTVTDTYYFAQV